MAGARLAGGAQPDRGSGEHRTDLLRGAQPDRGSGEHRTDPLRGAQPDRGSGEHRTDRLTLTLASRSPQRRAILEQLGISFAVAAPDVEEIVDGDPHELVTENALRKARAVEGERVLGVDTAVVLDDRVFGKPRGVQEARAFLAALSGRTHEVWSGIALIEEDAQRVGVAVTRVAFRRLTAADIDWYAESGEWRGRAGGYAIQARGAALVERIEGDYLNVVGLPVAELIRMAPGLLTDP